MRAIVALALLAALASTSASAGSGPPSFSHDVHVNNFERRCLDCHTLPREGPPQVDREGCLYCHEPKPPAYRTTRTAPLTPPFPHAPHAQSLECLTCHQQVLDDGRVRGQPVMPRRECADCHARRGLKTAERRCEACHEGDQRRVRPADHVAAWLELHGQAADVRGLEEHGHDCAACHGSDACVRCHRERKPKSHTGLWDLRMHGVAASFDREGCKACHETGVCVRCHQTTPPLNHTGAWSKLHGLAAAGTDNEHCRACHTAAQCTACHRMGQ
jgi:hypothetical protein